MTKLWKHDGKWRFMATVGKIRRAVLEVPFDADQDEAQAIADAEVEAQAAIDANYHPWEVKADAKPAAKPKVEEWEISCTISWVSWGSSMTNPPHPKNGEGWEPYGASHHLFPQDKNIAYYVYWRRPKP